MIKDGIIKNPYLLQNYKHNFIEITKLISSSSNMKMLVCTNWQTMDRQSQIKILFLFLERENLLIRLKNCKWRECFKKYYIFSSKFVILRSWINFLRIKMVGILSWNYGFYLNNAVLDTCYVYVMSWLHKKIKFIVDRNF